MITSESGRSIGEMLSVLAIMGVLSVVGLAVYKIAMDKKEANNIIHDGRTAHTLILSKEETTEDWTSIPEFIADTQKTFTYYVDSEKHHYIKVDSVEKSVCQQMVALSGDNLHFYKADGTVFSACADDISMVIDYDNNGPIVECLTYSDCTGENAYCSDGQCNTCANGRTVNDDKTGCNCSADELTCSDEEDNTWCCGKNANDKPTICGTTKDECVESDGMCSYSMTQQTQTVAANCSYKMTQQTQTIAANCSYKLSGSEGNMSMSAITACTGANEYCYLAYSDNKCTSGLGASATGIMYGTCIKQTSANSQCNISAVSEVLTPIQKCTGENEYCYLAYSDDECTSGLGASATGTMYGTCIKQTSVNSQCNISEVSETLSPILTCPVHQYCYLTWKESNCSGELGASATGTMYGACIAQDSNNAVCPLEN